jgi:hypothetical protein
MNGYSGAATMEGRPPEVLVAWRADVSAGGAAGMVRVRAQMGAGGTAALGDPVLLPAEPGSYTFPAPHLRWDYRGGRLGLEQTTGGHQIVNRRPCQPEYGWWGDPCQIYRVDVLDPPGESWAGAQLALTGITEVDLDEDLRGDATEDRTDLRMRAATSRDDDGRLRTTVVLTNAGPLAADRPALKAVSSPGISARWQNTCALESTQTLPSRHSCVLEPLAAGASRTLTLISESPVAVTNALSVRGEGPDLADADNATTVTVAAPPAVALTAARSQTLRRGIKVRLTASRTGRARVTVAIRGSRIRLARTVHVKAYTPRSVTLRARGAKLRALRAALPLRAKITTRRLGSKPAASMRMTVR